MDDFAVDSLDNESIGDKNQIDNPKLHEIRNKQKLHEKAEHLLGRSYRNAVVHQAKNSTNSNNLNLS
jgi:hypothetical protein